MSARRAAVEPGLSELIDLVADESAAPGAGAVASGSVAMAAGLAAMSARRSKQAWPGAGSAAGQADVLRSRASALIAESAGAYERAVAALERPGEDPEASAEQRDWQLGLALQRAAQAPLRCAQIAADVAELAAEVAEHAEASSRADAVAGCVLAEASARIGAHLVEINLVTAEDDVRLTQACAATERAARSRERALAA